MSVTDDLNSAYYVAHNGRAVAVSDKRRPATERLEFTPTPDEIARAQEIRLELCDYDASYSVTFRGKPIRKGLDRGQARELAAEVNAEPERFVKRRAELAGDHAVRIWAQHLAGKALLAAERDAALHGPCKLICPRSGEVLKVLPANSSTPQRKSLAAKLAERSRAKAIRELRAAE